MAQLLIDDIIEGGDGSPMIVTFQNGYLTDTFQNEPCTLLLDTQTDGHIFATELDGILYTGTVLQEANIDAFMVARNRITGKVRVLDTGFVEMRPELELDTETQFQEINNLELSRKFGSKKQKQQMEQKEKLKVNIETVTEQMLQVTEGIKEEQVDLSAYTSTNAEDFYIPPINRSAEQPEDVYDLNKILTEDDYNKIAEQLDGKQYKSDMIPWLQNLISGKDLSPKHIVLAVYANSLLKLYNTIAKDMAKRAFYACKYSTTLNDIILHNFAVISNGKLLRPGPYRDKALCYAMVLILLINNLKFDLELFCHAMKITPSNASMKVRTTGATVVTSGGKKVVQLKIPLNNKSGFRRKSAKF